MSSRRNFRRRQLPDLTAKRAKDAGGAEPSLPILAILASLAVEDERSASAGRKD